MSTRARVVLLSSALVLSMSGSALAGPDWVEVGDAGSLAQTAQFPLRPKGATALTSISGVLTGSGDGVTDFEDMYYFRVTDPGSFQIRPQFTDFDAVLYLFNITVNGEALGLLANNDENANSSVPRLLAASTDGSGVELTQPGDYLLAICAVGRFPVSRTGRIFNIASPTEISGPDGPGGLNPLEGWGGEAIGGNYTLVLTSSDFPRIPAPGAGVLLAAGAMLAARRKRA